MRDAFFNGLYEVIEADKNVMVLTADHGAFGLNKIQEDFPDQYLNLGIAEQNMVSVAAGLALSGKIVYIYSIINFVTLRCLEQINIDIASMNLHINIVGVGAGFIYSTDGPTHHGTQDVAIMSAIPNLSIYNCSDTVNTHAFAKLGYQKGGPKYFRIQKGTVPNLYNKNFFLDNGMGRIKTGNDVVIISSGLLIHKLVKIIDSIELNDIAIGLIDIYQIKPFNKKYLIKILKDVKRIIVIEDNIAIGGLADNVCTHLYENKIYIPIVKINILDQFCFKYSTKREWVEANQCLDPKELRNIIVDNCNTIKCNNNA